MVLSPGEDNSDRPAGDTSGVSKVRRIEGDLRRRIGSGEMPVGSMLPGRQALARHYGVALATLERAVEALLTEGLLRADNGRGTFVARAGVGGSSALSGKVIGLVAPSTYDFRIRILAEQIEGECSRLGATTRFLSRTPDEDPRQMARGDRATVLLAEAIEEIQTQSEALLLLCYYDPLEEVALATQNLEIPHIAITAGALAEGHPTPHLFFENREAGRQAAETLISPPSPDAGDQMVWLVAPITDTWVEERIAGARTVLKERLRLIAGPEGRRQDARLAGDHQEEGRRAIQAALQQGSLPLTGYPRLIGVSDHTAYGVMDALTEQGLVPGKDYALIGIGDSAPSRARGLTTVRPPLEELARTSVRLLCTGLAGGMVERQTRLQPSLVRRSTTPLLPFLL